MLHFPFRSLQFGIREIHRFNLEIEICRERKEKKERKKEKKKRKKKIALGWSRTRVNGLVAEYADSVATLMDGNERDRDARPTNQPTVSN